MPDNRRLLLAAIAALLAALPAPLFAATFSISRAGLAGPGYTQTGNIAFASPAGLNDADQVLGLSLRYSGSTFLGQDAWLYDHATNTSVSIGLTGGLFTQVNGFQSSSPLLLNPIGQAIGTSARYTAAGGGLGQSAWFYDFSTNTTRMIGLTDAAHTASDNTQTSTPVQLFNQRFAAGNSDIYSGTTTVGSTAWFYDRTANATTAIGLTDATHTAASGLQSSEVVRATSAGIFYIAGDSDRYTGNTVSGQDAWLYAPGVGITPIGFSNPAIYSVSAPTGISNSGIVIGTSQRLTGDNDAWRYTISSNTLETLGLSAAPHLAPNGESSNTPLDLNSAGDVIGTSVQFSGGFGLGQSAWFQAQGSAAAIQVGLYGAGYEIAGVHSSTPEKIAANGIVGGTSERNGALADGNAAWAFSPVTTVTTRIGLFDGSHTSGSFQNSDVTAINSSGQMIGTSDHFDANGDVQTGWFYDPTTLTTTAITGPGIFYTSPELIGDDGVVLGTYAVYDGAGNELSENAFYWTLGGGAVNLGTLVASGLSVSGWQSLHDTLARNDSGAIAGGGVASNQSDGTAAYLLTPPAAIPEPASLALLALGCTLLARRATRLVPALGPGKTNLF